MLIVKTTTLWLSFMMIAVIEPLSLPSVIVCSSLAGLLGGFTSAKRLGVTDANTISTHMLSMAQLGTAMSLLGYGYLDEDPTEGYKLIGIACLVALIGMPIFEPLTETSTAIVKVLAEKILKWIGAKKN